MHRVDRSQLREILHDYKRECFRLAHSEEREQVESEAKRLVDEIVGLKFHYQFHKPVDPERAEILDLIDHYCREAVLPPVLKVLAERIVLIEKRQEAAIRALGRIGSLLEGED